MTIGMFVYVAQRSDGLIRIGSTIRLTQRLWHLQKKYGDIQVLGIIPGYLSEEAGLHARFERYQMVTVGSNGHEYVTDWFQPVPEILNWAKESTLPYNPQSGKKYDKPVYAPCRIYDEFELTIPAPARGLSADSEEAA